MKAGVPVILVSGTPAGASLEHPKSTPFSQPPAYGTRRSLAVASASGRGQKGGCRGCAAAAGAALACCRLAAISAAMSRRCDAAVSLPRPEAAGGSGTAAQDGQHVSMASSFNFLRLQG